MNHSFMAVPIKIGLIESNGKAKRAQNSIRMFLGRGESGGKMFIAGRSMAHPWTSHHRWRASDLHTKWIRNAWIEFPFQKCQLFWFEITEMWIFSSTYLWMKSIFIFFREVTKTIWKLGKLPWSFWSGREISFRLEENLVRKFVLRILDHRITADERLSCIQSGLKLRQVNFQLTAFIIALNGLFCSS